MVDGSVLREHIRMVGDRQSLRTGRQDIHVLFLLTFHIPNSSVFAVCGTAARRSQGTGFASLRVLDSGVLPCR